MAKQPGELFDLSDLAIEEKALQFKPLDCAVWTGNKARLIQRYIRFFTYITKHGTYIDAFAGPQSPKHYEGWAAKLVMEATPRWIRHFALFEKNRVKFRHLNEVVNGQPKVKSRDFVCQHGDMNVLLPAYLEKNPIRETEATFCLLDQHTFECDWRTVVTLATHKKAGNKIEQFYFLAQGWLDRAVAGTKKNKDSKLLKWWGDDSWETLLKTPSYDRGLLLAQRFKKELGYKYALSFPIFEKPSSTGNGKIMFHMIHASDHPDAPKQMIRAYAGAVAPIDSKKQAEFELGDLTGRLFG